MSREDVQQVVNLFKRAAEVFENRRAGMEWLDEPLDICNGRTPFEEAMSSGNGYEHVMSILGRIEHGTFS